MVNHKPCPFCGGRRLQTRDLWDVYRFVACRDCSAAGPKGHDDAEAWKRWDERKGPDQGSLFESPFEDVFQ